MPSWVSRFPATTEVRLCAIIWSFGFVLVLLSMAAQGRITSPFIVLTVVPLIALGAGLSLAAARVIGRASRAGRLAAAGATVLAVLAAGGLMSLADHHWNRLLALTVIPSWRDWALRMDPSEGFIIAVLYTWTLLLSLAMVWAARTSDAARMNEARAAAFEAAALRAEAAYLRLQLNPHLVFNTLNGIASLVVRGKDREAEEMIGRLADFMRATFASDPAAAVPLEKELETVRAYLRIEEARFGDRLKVRYEVEDAALAVQVPNFLLQPLVENAVKHGLARSRGEIRVVGGIEAGMLNLAVTNHGGGPPAAAPAGKGGGLGLANTRQRLESVYGDRAAMQAGPDAGGFTVRLALPLQATAGLRAAVR